MIFQWVNKARWILRDRPRASTSALQCRHAHEGRCGRRRLPNLHHSAQHFVHEYPVPDESPCRASSVVAGPAIIALLLSLPLAAPAAAADGDPISVKVNMARILRINAPAATVIIGNPGVADVTIQDPQTLVLTGKSYGQTNLIVLDTWQPDRRHADRGRPGAGRPDDRSIRATRGSTLACAPTCQPTIMLGDDPGFTRPAMGSSQSSRTPRN